MQGRGVLFSVSAGLLLVYYTAKAVMGDGWFRFEEVYGTFRPFRFGKNGHSMATQ